MRRLAVFSVLLLLGAQPRAARANGEPNTDAALYESGFVHFERGEYGEACGDFHALWSRGTFEARGDLALALGQCHRLQGHPTTALYFFEHAAAFYGASPSSEGEFWRQVIAEETRRVLNSVTRATITLPRGIVSLNVDEGVLVRLELPALRALYPAGDATHAQRLQDGCFANVALGDPSPGEASTQACSWRDTVEITMSTIESHVLCIDYSEAEGDARIPLPKGKLKATAAPTFDVTAAKAEVAIDVVAPADNSEITVTFTPADKGGQLEPYRLTPHGGKVSAPLWPGKYAVEWTVPGDLKAATGSDSQLASTIELRPGQRLGQTVRFEKEDASFPWLWVGGLVALAAVGVGVVCVAAKCFEREAPSEGSLKWTVEVP